MPTPEEIIEQNIAAPSSASTGAGSVSQHSLKDQMEAADWLAKRKAAKAGFTGFAAQVAVSGSAING